MQLNVLIVRNNLTLMKMLKKCIICMIVAIWFVKNVFPNKSKVNI